MIDSDPISSMPNRCIGAGRGLKEPMLYSEANEGFKAYGVAHHRHMGELDQELSKAAGKMLCNIHTAFGPHDTGYAGDHLCKGDADAVRAHLASYYADEPFVHVLAEGEVPQTQHVKGIQYLPYRGFCGPSGGARDHSVRP